LGRTGNNRQGGGGEESVSEAGHHARGTQTLIDPALPVSGCRIGNIDTHRSGRDNG
jgi:hypothetical protein